MELVVATSVLLIFTAFALQFLASTNSATSRTTKDVTAENAARNALRLMTEDIRAADPITTTYPSTSSCPSSASYPTGYGSCLSFTVVHNSAAGVTCPKSVITYGLVSGAIKRDKVDYDSSCTTTTTTTGKTVLSNVVNASGTNVFRYFDSSGNELTSGAQSSSFQSAAAVMVTLVVQYQSGAPNITVSSTAALRNNRV